MLATEGGDWSDDDGAVVMKENPDDWSVCEVVDGSETLDNWVELYDEDNKLWNMDVDVEVEVRHWTTGLSCTMKTTHFGTWTLMWRWRCYRMMTTLSI